MLSEIISHLHPILVHFPIALIVVGVCYDIYGVITRKFLSPERGIWLWIVALIGSLLAIMTGPEHDARGVSQLIEIHSTLADLTAWITFLVVAIRLWMWRAKKTIKGGTLAGYVLASVVSAGLVLATGYYGGAMVYDQGIGVQVNGKLVNPPVKSFHKYQQGQ